MTNIMDELSAQHQNLLGLVQEVDKKDDVLPEVLKFLEWLADSGSKVSETRRRSQLRGLIRFWSSFIYDRTGEFPDVQLLPSLDVESLPNDVETEGRDSTTEQLRAQVEEVLEQDTKEPRYTTRKLARTLDETAELEGKPVVAVKQIGPYEIIDEIGKGGFSKVYKAFDTSTEELVALKVLQGEQFQRSQRFRERLMQREQLVAKLDHPNIIPVHSVAEYDGLPCIAMKLIESGSLADRLAHWYWKPSVRAILEIVCQTCEGLDYLHNKQIVHRDIKPSNLLLGFDDHVYLTDFGIAQVVESAFKGMIVGTPEYLAPEAVLHPDDVDEKADLYSIGIILFELFMGQPPFRSKSTVELLHLQVNEPIPPIEGIPEEIVRVILKCLAKDPDERFQSARQLANEIQRLLSPLPITALETPPAPLISPPETRFKPHDTEIIEPIDRGLTLCPQCGANNVPGAAFCDECGSSLASVAPAAPSAPVQRPAAPGEVTCPACGVPNPSGVAFCDNCGASLATAPSAPSPPQPSPPQPLPWPRPSDEQGTLLLEGPLRPLTEAVLAILIVRSGSLTKDSFTVRQSRTTVGRGQYNDIVIDEPSVSRQHALLVYERREGRPGVFTLYDLASANGTFINREQPCVKRRLKHNDIITLGSVELLFKQLDDDPKPISKENDAQPKT